MIVIVDYGRGNLFSLGQALRHVGAEYTVSADADEIIAAPRLILPGVGAFGDAMRTLAERGLVEPIRRAVGRGVPFLGICIGMQLLCSESEEFGRHQGFGFIPGTVTRLTEGDETRIPNIGWRSLNPAPDGFLRDLAAGTMAYFVHSYAPETEDPADVAATIRINGKEVPAVIRRDNVIGYQFHPEKSGPAGLDLLRRFLQLY